MNSSQQLCDLVQKQSTWVWYQLRQARIAKYQIHEQSITDFFIKNLLRKKIPGFSVKAFTTRQEAKTGADFEIWFNGPSHKWFGLRIQAKILNFEKSAFLKLRYKNQLNTLIQDAQQVGAFPIYCLYSNWDYGNKLIRRRRCCQSLSISQFGVSLISVASAVKLKAKSQYGLTKVVQHMFPFACLFCDTCSGKSLGLTSRATQFIKNNLDSQSELIEGQNHWQLESPPSHVSKLIELRSAELGPVMDELNLSHVVVISESNQTE